MLKWAFSVVLACVMVVPAFAERTKPASIEELAAITERGKKLAEYDQAAWHGTDAVVALKPDERLINRYIARRTDAGWVVAFGKLNEKKDRFVIAYEAVQGKTLQDFTGRKLETPKEDDGSFLFAARAIELALADFTAPKRPYNVAVLPAEKDRFYVYLLPAQTQGDVFPLGGDVRYLVSKDGLNIVEKRQLHNSIIEFRGQEGVEAGFHTAVLDDIPEDTDVFHVLARFPSVAEWVLTPKFVYQIAPDGAIKYVMTAEAFKKIPR